ncbi:hypothetical protein GGX14DRAFT_391138 [Mycena pura]|uniref:Uncharacterized protein n=1 Tax=Mycena pura TaxID=153505 RepID=A0AAD6VR38_9AGAR|nr:hypothetical protein GGX14DRAFT_391138 [Mycena pura]
MHRHWAAADRAAFPDKYDVCGLKVAAARRRAQLITIEHLGSHMSRVTGPSGCRKFSAVTTNLPSCRKFWDGHIIFAEKNLTYTIIICLLPYASLSTTARPSPFGDESVIRSSPLASDRPSRILPDETPSSPTRHRVTTRENFSPRLRLRDMAVYYDYYDPYDYEPTFYDAAEPNYAADDDYCDDVAYSTDYAPTDYGDVTDAAEYDDVVCDMDVVSQLSFDPETATDAQIDASAWGVHWFRGPPPGVSPDTWRDDMDEWRLRIEASLEAEAMHPHDDGCERKATALPADDNMYDTRHFWDPARYDGDPHYGLSVTDNLQPPPSVRKYILEDQAALDADQVPDDRRKEFLEELRLLCEDERYYDRCRAAGFVWNEQCREYFPPPEFWRPEAIHAVHDRRLLPLRLTYPGFGLPPPPATSHPLSQRGRAARSAMPIFRHTRPRSFGSSTRRALRPRDAPPSPTKHPPRRLPRRPPACVAQPVLQLSTVQNRPQSHSCREPPPHLPVLSTTVSMPPLISTSPAPPSAVRDRKEPMPPDRSMVTADDLLDPAASSTSARMVRCGEHPEDTVTLPRAPKPPDLGALGTPSKPTVADGGVAQRRRNAARRIARKAQSARGCALSWGGEG